MIKLAHWIAAAGLVLFASGCTPGGYEPATFRMGKPHHHHGSYHSAGSRWSTGSGAGFRSSGGRK